MEEIPTQLISRALIQLLPADDISHNCRLAEIKQAASMEEGKRLMLAKALAGEAFPELLRRKKEPEAASPSRGGCYGAHSETDTACCGEGSYESEAAPRGREPGQKIRGHQEDPSANSHSRRAGETRTSPDIQPGGTIEGPGRADEAHQKGAGSKEQQEGL
ncbi:hypothetical protein Y1Q_0008854 [Alligator mississippiensis]|uniref:Uncharacterized protein n=1 Tax=Alligator mississippiensis TaxID=8496 RepID=A0A151NA69_ALLMI|nr:hypothetical protein Y1Q_0008854 [Alligator mississippiensis]